MENDPLELVGTALVARISLSALLGDAESCALLAIGCSTWRQVAALLSPAIRELFEVGKRRNGGVRVIAFAPGVGSPVDESLFPGKNERSASTRLEFRDVGEGHWDLVVFSPHVCENPGEFRAIVLRGMLALRSSNPAGRLFICVPTNLDTSPETVRRKLGVTSAAITRATVTTEAMSVSFSSSSSAMSSSTSQTALSKPIPIPDATSDQRSQQTATGASDGVTLDDVLERLGVVEYSLASLVTHVNVGNYLRQTPEGYAEAARWLNVAPVGVLESATRPDVLVWLKRLCEVSATYPNSSSPNVVASGSGNNNHHATPSTVTGIKSMRLPQPKSLYILPPCTGFELDRRAQPRRESWWDTSTTVAGRFPESTSAAYKLLDNTGTLEGSTVGEAEDAMAMTLRPWRRFKNHGMTTWTAARHRWVHPPQPQPNKKEPLAKLSSFQLNELVETLANTHDKCELPGPIRLDDLLEVLVDIWDSADDAD